MLLVSQLTFGQTQSAPDDRFRISLTVNGTPVQGSQEISLASMGKTTSERRALQDAATLIVQRNASFQAAVTVTSPDGTATNFTGSSRLIYEHFGCLTVTTTGFVTIAPSGGCKGPNFPTLWIAFTDQGGQPITYNEYQLRVSD
ncbi:MAG: hypothetical protein MUC68_04010 [Burkholderiaceae bacterium]|jgi:hypothetical protein|nr:hypothetical protein [Burkholderiaceae bacterium]